MARVFGNPSEQLGRAKHIVQIVAIGLLSPLLCSAEIVTGQISGWQESSSVLEIGDGANSVRIWWSFAAADQGYFYGSVFTSSSDVAAAPMLTEVGQVTDASVFGYTDQLTVALCDQDCDPDSTGDFVIYKNISSGHFAVVRIDNIVGNAMDATWWFQSDGSGDFSQQSADPDDLFESGSLATFLSRSPGDLFGSAIDIDKDVAVVGSPYAQLSGGNGGRVSIYERSGPGAWEEVEFFLNPHPPLTVGSCGRFGESVAVAGNKVVVGDASCNFVQIIERSGPGDWRATRILTDSSYSFFGHEVDYDGESLVVAAESDVVLVYVEEPSGDWVLQDILTADDGQVGDGFGDDLAVDGDTIVVGAPGVDLPGVFRPINAAGAAYVFARQAGGNWEQQSKLIANNYNQDDQLGSSVSVSGNTIVAGTWQNVGAYSFVRNPDNSWTQEQEFLLGNVEAPYLIGGGYSVSIHGDLVLIGSNVGFISSGVEHLGAAYLFHRGADGLWRLHARLLKAGDIPAADASFAASVVLNGQEALVSAPTANYNRGEVHTFALPDLSDADGDSIPASIDNCPDVANPQQTDTDGDGIGNACEPIAPITLSDMNGNGSPEIAVLDHGSVRVFIRDGSTDALITDIDFGTDAALQMMRLPDLDASGGPEIAILQQQPSGQVRVQVRDSSTGALTGNFFYGQPYAPVAMRVIDDYSGNGAPEIAVMGSDATDAIRVQVKDMSNGTTLDNVFLGNQGIGRDFVAVSDTSGNSVPELAILSVLKGNDQVRTQVWDAADSTFQTNVWFGKVYQPYKLMTMPDINGNGSDEIVAIGVDPATQNIRVQVRDSASTITHYNIWLGNTNQAVDIALINDINGNGFADLAVLLKTPTGTGRVRVQDGLNGAFIRNLFYTVVENPTGLTVMPDYSGNGFEELAVVGESAGVQHVQILDTRSGSQVNRIDYP